MNTPLTATARHCILAALLGSLPANTDGDELGGSPPVDFNRDVRQILSENCFFCHGPDAAHREGGLRLDQREAAFAAGDSGELAIVPGKPEESEVMRRIRSSDADERMPKAESGKQLTAEEISLLGRWIEEGASWQEHWAYRPPVRIAPPPVSDRQWCHNWVDRFVLARLDSEGLDPTPEADRITLIRRLSFDLTGLPPEPVEVAEFIANDHPAAYEALVDRLLASPHYGERMAMYWLDLVRYADTVGYHGDQDHNISPYRDYVIGAFNDNMSLDRFSREQLAGDLIADRDPGGLDEEARTKLKIASGYNRLLQTSHEGGVQKKEYLAIYAADRIRNLSNVWMGATMGCCQCHDHKFDPYTMRDFYSMVAFFADIDESRTFAGSNTIPTNREPEIVLLSPTDQKRVADLERRISQLRIGDGEEKELAELAQRKAGIEQQARRSMITVAVEPRLIRVLPRGNWLDDSGELVEPSIPTFLGELETGGRRADRLDLARWLTDTKNGSGLLTARVFANRFWYLLFGRGLARQLDDFGGQGSPPSHTGLLDALAIHLAKSGWDTKGMMKLLVMSRSYRLSSIVTEKMQILDPENRLLARQSRFRLPAEMIRDTALAISGLLQRDVGGASSKPYQPVGYYRHLNFPERTYKSDQDEQQWRRGVYVHWQRQFLHPMLRALDAPRREECTAERSRSNTPAAALVLLNDPTFIEAARVLSERIIQEGGKSDDRRIEFVFRRAVSRPPDATELSLLKKLLQQSRELYRQDPAAAEAVCRTGLQPPGEGVNWVELASWTSVARSLLNMHETINRN